MNVEKTQEYYKQLGFDDLCDCAYCKNYIMQIRRNYPVITQYLKKLGVDIEKPFETMPLEPDKDGNIEYIAVQYIVYGECNGFEKSIINSVNVDIAKHYPSTEIKEAHFVIEIFPIRLKWVM